MTINRLRRTAGRRALAVTAALSMGLAACGASDEPVAEADRTSEQTGDEQTSDEQTGSEASGDDAEPSTDRPGSGSVEPDLPAEIPTDLVITDITQGTGRSAEVGDTVVLDYVGVLTADGTEFDNSYDRGQPLEIVIGTTGLIDGFTSGLIGVQAGTVRQLDIPSDLAYGDAGAGDVIPPGAAITFVIEVRSVEAPPPPPSLAPQAAPEDCPPASGSDEQQQQFDEYPPTCIDVTRTYTAELVTNFGDITIELDAARAPLAVNSFVTLARYRYFDGTQCHRAIPGFVVQCGDPTATGSGGPGYRFADELPSAGEYEIGSVAMANAGPDTNGSQFFIITGPNGASLPPQYTLFGTVVAGLDTTVAELDAVANPTNNGVPPLAEIVIESITITEN